MFELFEEYNGFDCIEVFELTEYNDVEYFLQFGAFPVFVVDGNPSPLKSQARTARFFRLSGIDLSSLPAADHGVSVDRNHKFSKCVQECVVSCFHSKGLF